MDTQREAAIQESMEGTSETISSAEECSELKEGEREGGGE